MSTQPVRSFGRQSACSEIPVELPTSGFTFEARYTDESTTQISSITAIFIINESSKYQLDLIAKSSALTRLSFSWLLKNEPVFSKHEEASLSLLEVRKYEKELSLEGQRHFKVIKMQNDVTMRTQKNFYKSAGAIELDHENKFISTIADPQLALQDKKVRKAHLADAVVSSADANVYLAFVTGMSLDWSRSYVSDKAFGLSSLYKGKLTVTKEKERFSFNIIYHKPIDSAPASEKYFFSKVYDNDTPKELTLEEDTKTEKKLQVSQKKSPPIGLGQGHWKVVQKKGD
ncbi:MAG: hypothetical protein S4CHLAM7_13490 [Chlamydiae bacterium]|nr:hypothetical protein [Chlamydiota bacterium]